MFVDSYLGNNISHTIKFYIKYQPYSSMKIVCWCHQQNMEMSYDICFSSHGIVQNCSNLLIESQPTPLEDTRISYLDTNAPYKLTHQVDIDWTNLFAKYPCIYDNFLILHISKPELITDIQLEYMLTDPLN